MVRMAASNDNRKKRRKSGAQASAATLAHVIQDLYGAEATLPPSIQSSQSPEDDGDERE
jgi:hypothetical protein